MSRAGEVGWPELEKAWRAGPAVDPSEIRRLADRQTVLMRHAVLGEVAITLVAAAALWWVLRVQRGSLALGLVVAVGIHVGVVWGFAIWNRVGIWRPLGASTADYLHLAQERFRRQRRSAEFTLWLVGIEVGALLVWVFVAAPHRPPRQWWALLPAVVVLAGAIGWALWYRARAVRQLARLGDLESQMAIEGGNP